MASINTLDLLAIACAAYRINGNQLLKESTKEHIANGVLVKSHIYEPSKHKLEILEEDAEKAQEVKSYIAQRITLSRLTGKVVGEFVAQIAELIEQEQVPLNKVGILTWAPKVFADMVKVDDQQLEFAAIGTTSNYIGKLGDKVELDFTTVSKKFNSNFNCWRYTGHDSKGNLVGFLSKNDYPAQVRIKGRIKAQEESRFTNGKTTYLNYTKEVK